MEFGFGGFNIMFTLVFILVMGTFVFVLVKGLSQWNKNNHSPVLTVPATIVAKRAAYHHNAGEHAMGHTTYFATFQVESGDRMELQIPYGQYGYLVEQDSGRLTFQGTRFLKFERQ